MTVFRTYLKVLNKNKTLVILYTVILIFFAAFNMKTNDTKMDFVAEKPDVLIVSEDENKGITKGFLSYMEKNSTLKSIKENENARNDALFYRDVNYIIYLPKNFGKDFLDGKNPKIQMKSTGDYQASLADMMVKRYFNVAGIYKTVATDEDTLVSLIEETLAKEATIEITSKLDTDHLKKATLFYNFANYSILAGCVYVICFIISSFKNKPIQNRTIISSMNYKKYNRDLLLSNALFVLTLWLFYVVLSILLVGNIMFTGHGLLLIINSLLFTICALTLAFLIANLVSNKEAISGIVNVIALGSSFLCGAFVPMEWLPDFVLKIAHVLPSYYYISNNEMISKLEDFGLESLQNVIINMGILIIFMIVFVIITNAVSKSKNRGSY